METVKAKEERRHVHIFDIFCRLDKFSFRYIIGGIGKPNRFLTWDLVEITNTIRIYIF